MKRNIGDYWKRSSLEETVEYSRMTKDTIRSGIKKGNISTHKIQRLWEFWLSEVDDWVKSGKSVL